MKLHLTRPEGKNLITGYGTHWVRINDQQHDTSLIVCPDSPVMPWPVNAISALTAEDFLPILELSPEVLLIGSGEKLIFPASASLKLIINKGIGFEVMDTAAACRTYNILMAEGRNVAAALIL